MRHFLGHFVVLSQPLADHRLHDPIEAGGLAGSIYHGTAIRHVRYPTLAHVRQIGEPQLVPESRRELQNIVIRDMSRAPCGIVGASLPRISCVTRPRSRLGREIKEMRTFGSRGPGVGGQGHPNRRPVAIQPHAPDPLGTPVAGFAPIWASAEAPQDTVWFSQGAHEPFPMTANLNPQAPLRRRQGAEQPGAKAAASRSPR